jgi:hypothetical protein
MLAMCQSSGSGKHPPMLQCISFIKNKIFSYSMDETWEDILKDLLEEYKAFKCNFFFFNNFPTYLGLIFFSQILENQFQCRIFPLVISSQAFWIAVSTNILTFLTYGQTPLPSTLLQNTDSSIPSEKNTKIYIQD